MRENELVSGTAKQSGVSVLIPAFTGTVTAILGVLLLVWMPPGLGAILGGIFVLLGVGGLVRGIAAWARRGQVAADPGQKFGSYSSLTIMLWFLSAGLLFRAYYDVYRIELSVWTNAWVSSGAVVWVLSMVASKRAIKWLWRS